MRLRILGCALVVASTVLGCGSGAEDPSHVPAAAARVYAIEYYKMALAGLDRAPTPYWSVRDLLANVRWVGHDGDAGAATDAVIVGTPSEVEEGYGFTGVASGIQGRRVGGLVAIPFDSPDARWRTIHVTLDVEQVISGEVAGRAKRIVVGFPLWIENTDGDQVRQGLGALGRTVWFLHRDSDRFAYDPSLYKNLDERLIAAVEPDGSLTFPILDVRDPLAATLGRPTLDQLREAAQLPLRTIRLRI